MNLRSKHLATPVLAALALAAVLVVHAQVSAPAVAADFISELGLIESDKPVRELPGWRAPKKVLVLGYAPPLADLQAAAPGVVFVVGRDLADPEVNISDADVIIGDCSQPLLAKARQVRWVQVMNTGVEQCVAVPAMKERQILLTNMQRANAAVIGEHAMALALALARNLEMYVANQQQGSWSDRSAGSMRTLNGKTLLVVGLGGIGTEVARRGHALGMKVTATRASSRTGPEFVSYVGLPDELLTLAKDADVIINAAPLTPSTTGIFDARFFAALKPSAYFVNVARGRSVVTGALITALNEKRLAGAGLDVTDPEPLPANHALWRTPNVIITPHVAAASDLPRDKQLAIVRENLRRYVAGDKMLSVVDLSRGY
jgi:phosphoglycerate dehydrogenase-like enzyme